jgi:hypothetical protein
MLRNTISGLRNEALLGLGILYKKISLETILIYPGFDTEYKRRRSIANQTKIY